MAIEVHEIAGWGEETLATIEYRAKAVKCLKENEIISGLCDEYEYEWSPSLNKVIDGDGTVIATSALAISTSTPNVKRWWVDLDKYNRPIVGVNRKHKDILEIPDLLNLLKEINSTSTLATSDIIWENQPTTNSTRRLRFTLHSPLDLVVTDDSGNTVSSTTESISGGYFEGFGDVQYISVLADSNPKVTLTGYESGFFDLDIEESVGNEVVAETTFVTIPSKPTTLATIQFTDGTIENASNLDIDQDGDGEIDLSLEPKVGEIVTVPPLVQDTTAPEAKVSFSKDSFNNIETVGIDDITKDPVVDTSGGETTITDDAGNTLSFNSRTNNYKNRAHIDISELIYSTTTQTQFGTSALADYLWIEQRHKDDYLVFISNLATLDQRVSTIYNPFTKRTLITITNKNVEKPKHGRIKHEIIREVKSGLVVPYLETDKGEVFIKY